MKEYISKWRIALQISLLLVLIFTLLNLTGARLLRWSANQWLDSFDVEISELSFDGYSFKHLFFIDYFLDDQKRDFIQVSQLRFQKIKRVKRKGTKENSTNRNQFLALSFLSLSDIKFILDYQSPYFIKTIELSSGTAATSLDELLNLKVSFDANLDESLVDHSAEHSAGQPLVKNAVRPAIDFMFLKSLPDIKINSLILDVYSQHSISGSPISDNFTLSNSTSSNLTANNTLRLSLDDSNIEFGQQIKVEMHLKLADKHLLSLQMLEVNEHINGKLKLDLAGVAQLTQTFIELRPHFLPINFLPINFLSIQTKGQLSNTFDIGLTDQHWQINTANTITDGGLNNELNGVRWGVNVEGNFNVNFSQSDSGTALTFTTPKSDEINVSLTTSTIDSLLNEQLSEKLNEQLNELYKNELSEHSTSLLLAQLNQAVHIKVIKPVVFDLTDKILTGDLNLKSYTDSSSVDLSVAEISVSRQQSEFSWQLNVEQQQPIEPFSKVKLTTEGYFKQSPEGVMITIRDKSKLEILKPNFKLSSNKSPKPNSKQSPKPNSALNVKQPSVSAQNMTFTLLKPAELTWHNNTVKLMKPLMFNSLVNQLVFENNLIETFHGTHKVEQVLASVKSDSQWTINNLLELTSHHELMNGYLTGEIAVVNSSVDDFSSWLTLPETFVFTGEFSNQVSYQMKLADMQLSAQFHGEINQGTGSFGELLFSGVNANWQCQWRSLELNCTDNNMTIDLLDSGADISKLFIQSQFSWQNNQWVLNVEQFKGELFEGTFSTGNFKVTPELSFAGTVELKHFSLAEIVKLQQQKGIAVKGFINGTLPFEYDRNGLTIHHGILFNQNNGLIQIDGNPAIEQLKLSQPELKYALDALKELHFNVLKCDVDMSPDGSTQIKIKIVGTNPNIERPIHFNYLHDENLIQLFRSLQIGNVLNERIEKSIRKK